MAERVLVDNDVILKAASYSLCNALLSRTTILGVVPAILGVARYVVGGRINRMAGLINRTKALAAFDEFLGTVTELEPTDAEVEYAAELEAEASRHDVELDGGESQLLAILMTRGCDLLLTGDKRAINAISIIGPKRAHGRIGCFEQLMMDILVNMPAGALRQLVCGEPLADRAMAICFSCARQGAPPDEEIAQGLCSYINHLCTTSAGVLLSGYDLSAMRHT